MNLTIITVSNPIVSDIINAYKYIKEKYGNILCLKLFYVAKRNKITKEELASTIRESDFVILDLMGSSDEIQTWVLDICKTYKGNIVPFGGENQQIRNMLKLGKFTLNDMKMENSEEKNVDLEKIQKMINIAEKMGKAFPFGKLKDMRNYIFITKYWKNAGVFELKNLLLLILREYGGVKNIPKPVAPLNLKDVYICNPSNMEVFDDMESYYKKYSFDDTKPIVGVIFYGHNYPIRTSYCVSEIINKLKEFANVVPIALNTTNSKSIEELKEIISYNGKIKPDIIINFIPFRIGAGPMGGNVKKGIDLLEEMEAQYIHPFFMSKKEIKEWKESFQGLNPSEFLITIMLPELDGAIECIPVGGLEVTEFNYEFNVEINELKLIDERVNRIISKTKKWLELRKKPNNEKKVAFICYNYPPGEGNVFQGAFLDTFKSMSNILKILKENDYDVEELTEEMLMNNFISGKIANSPRWGLDNNTCMIKYHSEKYMKEFNYIDVKMDWGDPPGEIMTQGEDFLIPGIITGKVFVGLQPTRGVHEKPEKAYHDKNLTPHHQYIAFYKWIKEEFKADVIIHVGTHGTLEFLKGKECGVSGECYPDILIEDLPHIYLYYCGNPSEAMIAKRRSGAVIVSYQPPPFIKSELYGDLADIEGLICEYKEAKLLNPIRCDEIKNEILEKTKELNISFTELEDIENELYKIKNSLIPKGLHIFGNGYNDEEAIEYMKSVLRYDTGTDKTLKKLLAEIAGYDYDRLLKENNLSIFSEIDKNLNELIENYIKHEKIIINCDKNMLKEIKSILEYGKIAFKNSITNYEINGLLKVLNGKYLPAKLAGDPIKNVNVFPTGFNLYQFDSRLIPSNSAAKRGVMIAENTIECYKMKYGKYPKSVGVILWGLETSRTYGETVGQILHYLGVKVSNRKNLYQPEFEIIPIKDLGRPRIDVVINICGFFRDMFPNLIENFNKIFKMLWEMDENDEESYFKANSKKIYENLILSGLNHDEALELSYSRIFGPSDAEYGTTITNLIQTSNWLKEDEIAENYIKSLKYVYSNNYRAKEIPELYEKNLKAVDIVSQIRSNQEYEITDLDHYYEFFGGLSKSVETIKGKKAEIYISDTTGERIETETVEKSIARGVRTRILNPKWIEGMLEHKYHGVQKISEKFENILGLASTTNKVENWIFDNMYTVYFENENIKNKMIKDNKWAYLSMAEKLLECDKRGYWKATNVQIENLRKLYLEVEGEIEEDI
ncbi:MAG: magnesium chelatase subunit H [Caloramator sp.]|nr:magnesium chelatase subunit H [Caloramator sp.]